MTGCRYCEKGASLFSVSSTCQTKVQLLRIGMGSPGYTGCVSIDGPSIKWRKFTDPVTGTFGAMDVVEMWLM